MPELGADTDVRLTWRRAGRSWAYNGRLVDVKAEESEQRRNGAVLMRIHVDAGESYHAADVRLAKQP